MTMDQPTPEDFKTQFPKNFPYLPTWVEGSSYSAGDVVYYAPRFYRSLVDDNVLEPSDPEGWEITEGEVNDYVTDDQISGAMAEAFMVFNCGIFADPAKRLLAFLYLTAHFLTVDMRNISSGGASVFPSRSRRAGALSETLEINARFAQSPILSAYLTTGYGQKYLAMMGPHLVGQATFLFGTTLP